MKLFKSDRMNMIENKPLSKYLAYAFGEIILVVISILIALSINNWNEKRIQDVRLKNIYSIVAEDIKADTTELSNLIKELEKNKSYFLKVMGDSLSYDDFVACQECRYLATSFSSYVLDQTGKDLLVQYSSELGRDTLVMKIIQSYESINDLKVTIEKPISDDVFSILSEWRDKHDWYSKVILGLDDESHVHYLYKDWRHRNRLAHHYLLVYGNYYPSLIQTKKKFSELLIEVELRFQ